MEQTPFWEADSRSSTQVISRLLQKPMALYRVHNSAPPVPNLSHLNPIHNLPPDFPMIHLNIILPSTLRSWEWSRPFRLPNQNFVCTFNSHACYMSLPSYPPRFYLLKLLLYYFIHPPVISSLSGPDILLSTLFSNTLNLPIKSHILLLLKKKSNSQNYNFGKC
jgi:hypothetical protein